MAPFLCLTYGINSFIINTMNGMENFMKLNEQQLNHIEIVNKNIINDSFDNDDFLNSLEKLSEDSVDVESELLKRYGTKL